MDDLQNSTTTPANRVAGCWDTDVAYAAAAPLAGGSAFWCVDSTGASGVSFVDFTLHPSSEVDLVLEILSSNRFN